MDRSLESELAQELEANGESELENEFEAEAEGSHELEMESELEGEAELESELENESGEQFLGSVISGLGSMLGGLGESELEGELESELEGEFEQGEQFFGGLVKRFAPILRRVAKMAAPVVGKVVSGAIPGPWGALAGRGLQALGGSLESELESNEFEHEQELGEHEVAHELGEHELMAEAMAHFAAQAENELEAEAMMGAASGLTLSAADRRALRRLVPHMIRGAAILTRILRMRRDTRPWVRMVPSIMRRTARSLRQGAASGQPITRQRAGAVMAKQTRQVLSSPRYCRAVLRRNVRATRATTRPPVVARRTRAN